MEHYFAPSYWAAFGWGLAVLLGLIGLGRMVARLVGGPLALEAGWGLHAVWGMALYLFVGAGLAVFHAFDELRITLLIVAGLGELLWSAVRRRWTFRAGWAALPWNLWPAFALAGFSYAASILWQLYIIWADDFGAYYNFCEKLLVTGSFDEPFSWRRLASLGGQTLLQCSTLAHTSYANIQMFEIGLVPIILLGLLIGFRRGALSRTGLGLFLAVVAISTPILRINSASYATGLILFFGLFVTLDYVDGAEHRRRWLVAVGLVAAAFCSLRAQNTAAAAASLLVYWLAGWFRDRSAPRQALADALWCGGALLLALLPWMIMSFRSNHSLLFPLFPGTNNLAFNPQGIHGSFYQKFGLPMRMLTARLIFPLLLCLLVLPVWRKALAAHAIAVAAVLTSVVLACGLGLVPDDETILRYVQPLLLAGALAALVSAACQPGLRTAVWVITAICFTANLGTRSAELQLNYLALNLTPTSFRPFSTKTISEYRQAQLLIPEDRRVLICSDYPFFFDHLRNDLWSIDQPHAASPAPGLPFHRPPEETKRYLRQLGIEYLVFVDFDQSLNHYQRAHWQQNLEGKIPLWRIQAPFYLDFFETMEKLAATETILGREGALTVVQLKP